MKNTLTASGNIGKDAEVITVGEGENTRHAVKAYSRLDFPVPPNKTKSGKWEDKHGFWGTINVWCSSKDRADHIAKHLVKGTPFTVVNADFKAYYKDSDEKYPKPDGFDLDTRAVYFDVSRVASVEFRKGAEDAEAASDGEGDDA